MFTNLSEDINPRRGWSWRLKGGIHKHTDLHTLTYIYLKYEEGGLYWRRQLRRKGCSHAYIPPPPLQVAVCLSITIMIIVDKFHILGQDIDIYSPIIPPSLLYYSSPHLLAGTYSHHTVPLYSPIIPPSLLYYSSPHLLAGIATLLYPSTHQSSLPHYCITLVLTY